MYKIIEVLNVDTIQINCVRLQVTAREAYFIPEISRMLNLSCLRLISSETSGTA